MADDGFLAELEALEALIAGVPADRTICAEFAPNLLR